MSQNNAPARTVAADAKASGLVDVSSLILLAVLLAAGLILNLTVGNMLAMTGIKPQFIITAYALAILLTRAGFVQAGIFGLVSAAVITAGGSSVPGLNFLTELAGALVAAAFARADLKVADKSVTPLVATLAATLVSGTLFALVGTVMAGFAPAAALVKAPVVLGTTVFNAVIAQALFFPLRRALNK